ncbi:MAG TPA: hypothetical protein VHD87_11590 [Acidimicrobiales bacterium]|nr:hypothetical protein [Acidimicrobiales bacterium]
MYAVVFQVDIKPGRAADSGPELDQIATMTKSIPGFVRGTWMGDDTRGISFIVFESEETARGLAANAQVPENAAVALRSVDVFEVVQDA